MDKTELLWAGTRHVLSQEGVCFPSLQLAADTIHPSQHVRVSSQPTSALRNTSWRSARPAFTIFVNFDMSGIHSVRSLLWRWCTPLWCLELTTATSFLPGLQRLPLTNKVAASAEHGSSCDGYWYPEVRLQSEASDTFWAPLAWCTWAHQYVYASLSGWNCSTVSRCTLHPSLCDCLKTSSSFCCQSSVCCAGFLCHWPDDIELTTETSVWFYSHHNCFWTIT